MALQWMSSKNAVSSTASTTSYSHAGNTICSNSASETGRQRTIRTAGAWSNAYIRVVSNDRGASTFNSRVNGADGGQAIAIGAGATGEFEDTSGSDALSAGDEINWKLTTGAGGTVFLYRVVASNFAGTSVEMMLWTAVDSGNINVNGATRYQVLTGGLGGDVAITQTEANVQYSSRAAGTWRNLFVTVETNTKGGTSTVRSRVNAANGGQSLTIGAGATGFFEDTSGTDAVVSGDELNMAVEFFADANNLRFFTISSEFQPTASTAPMLSNSGAIGIVVLVNVTTYLQSGSQNVSTTETDMRVEANVAQTLSFLSVFVIANTLVGNTTVKARKSGADGAGLLTIGTAATGYFEDAANSDAFALGDELAFQVVTPAVGTSIIMNNLAILQNTTVAGGSTWPGYISPFGWN